VAAAAVAEKEAGLVPVGVPEVCLRKEAVVTNDH
jgi:hypothetical protein